jgi:hypothetical protein
MNKGILVIFLIDFLTGVSAWYVFLNAVNFVNMFTEELIYYAFVYIFNPLFSSAASIVIGYFSDKGHLNRFIGLTLFMMFVILLYQSFIKYDNLFLIYIILAIFNMAHTLYDVLKYSLVPKITTVFERINAVYELSYAILMVFGPLLSLLLMKAMYIAPLLPLASLLIFFNMSKKVEYRPFRSTYSFLSASRKIFLNKSFRLVSLLYLILTSAAPLS